MLIRKNFFWRDVWLAVYNWVYLNLVCFRPVRVMDKPFSWWSGSNIAHAHIDPHKQFIWLNMTSSCSFVKKKKKKKLEKKSSYCCIIKVLFEQWPLADGGVWFTCDRISRPATAAGHAKPCELVQSRAVDKKKKIKKTQREAASAALSASLLESGFILSWMKGKPP